MIRALRVLIAGCIIFGGMSQPAQCQLVQLKEPQPVLTATPEAGAFIIRMKDGRSVCREATAEEALALTRRELPVLHRITHVGDHASLTQTGGGLKIILNATQQLESFPQAKAAFQRAAATWEALIQTPITIQITVDFGSTLFGTPYGADVLGSTLSQTLAASNLYRGVRPALVARAHNARETALYAALPATNVPTDRGATERLAAPSALLRALGLIGPVADPTTDPAAWGELPSIGINSNFPFDLNPDDGIDLDKTDFDATVVHEIGHALGFTSQVGILEQNPAANLSVAVWDLFRFRPGTTIGTFQDATRIESSGGTQVFFANSSELALSTGTPDRTGGDHKQASHWKDDADTGQYIGIMDPSLANGSRAVITQNDLLAIDTFGYQLASTGGGSATSTKIIPIILDVSGRGGARFSTEITLANRGTSTTSIQLVYTAATVLGASGSGTTNETLGPGRQLVIADALNYLRGKGLQIPSTGSNQGGTLRVLFSGLSAAEAAYAGARTTSPSGSGQAGLAYPAFRLDEAQKGRSFIYGLRENANDRSNLALVNASTTSSITLRVTLLSGTGDGRSATLAPDTTLAPGQWTQIGSVLSAAGGFTNGIAVVSLISGEGPYYAYAVFNDNATNDGSYVSLEPEVVPAEFRLLPVLVETSTFQSELVLTNPYGQTQTLSLTYVESITPSGGTGGTVTETLQAGEQKIIPNAINYLRSKGARIGAQGTAAFGGALSALFKIGDTTIDGFIGARTASRGGGGQYGLFYPGIGPSAAATTEAWIYGLQQNSSVRANLAVANLGDAGGTISVRADVYDGTTGQLAGSTIESSLGPGGWFQLGGILSTFNLTNGYVRVVRTAGSSRFLAYGIVNDGATPNSGATNDGSYIGFSNR